MCSIANLSPSNTGKMHALSNTSVKTLLVSTINRHVTVAI